MANLDYLLKLHLQNRKVLRKVLLSVDDRQANEIPAGFNNNIIWNCAHVISLQQSLIYQLCGKMPVTEKTFIDNFTIGTKPKENFDKVFIDNVSELLISTSSQMADDIHGDIFTVLHPMMTAIKVELTTLEEALAFNNYHEGIHLGVITSLLKQLK